MNKNFLFTLIAFVSLFLLALIIQSCKKGEAVSADFSASPTRGNASLTVNFTDLSVNEPTSWRWNFGDGGSSTSQNPSHTYDAFGSYTVSLTAKNDIGSDIETKTTYIMVDCGGGSNPDGYFTDARDGQEYRYKIIGSQTWMVDNLNYETPDSKWYNDNRFYGAVYGRLYSWDAAILACPDGWHLPSNDEWKQLEIFLGMSPSDADKPGLRGTDEGTKMKSTCGWSFHGNGTNSSGFNALPGGTHDNYGNCYGLGISGHWWSSTENPPSQALSRLLSYGTDQVQMGYDFDWKTHGYSVRCVKD